MQSHKLGVLQNLMVKPMHFPLPTIFVRIITEFH